MIRLRESDTRVFKPSIGRLCENLYNSLREVCNKVKYETVLKEKRCECLQDKIRTVYLHRVFHSIRFKVNKGWTTAVVLFLCL